MKVILLIFLSALKFSLINSSHEFFQRKLPDFLNLEKRNLEETINKLMLVGFGNYNGDTFSIYFKNYNNMFSYAYLQLNTSISYKDGQNSTKIKCDFPRINDDEIIYSCPSENLNGSLGVKINDNFVFYYPNNTEIKIEVINSSLAKASEYNILSRQDSLEFLTFYLVSVLVSGNTAEIKGKLSGDIENKNYTLQSTVESYKCNVTDKEIKFNLTKTVKEHLIGKMIYDDSNEPKILIFSNETKNDLIDLLAYSSYKSGKSYPEFLGYYNYASPTISENATNRAHFRGEFVKLKKYLRFTAKIKRVLLLRSLQEDRYINATGVRDDENSDLENGYFIYNVTFENTVNNKILGIEKIGNFYFSDYLSYSTFTATDVTDIINSNSNLMEERIAKYKTFSLPNGREQINKNGTSFSFDISFQNDFLNAEENKANLSYISYLDGKENETDQCSLEQEYTNAYNLECSPKQDIYAILPSILIKIPLNSTLTLLQNNEKADILLLFPNNDVDGYINFKYVPNVRTYKKDKKGLSGGAITAIVIACVVAIIAIGVLIFFMKRKKPLAKPPINANFQDSSININN